MSVDKRLCALLCGLVLIVGSPSGAAAPKNSAAEYLHKARQAAATDRHRESIDYYRAAIRIKPALRSELALEVGHQYTWAEMPDSAIDWYEYYLLSHPDDVDAGIGVGRALSWADRLDESEKHFRLLLPKSGERRNDVLVGLAKVKSWQDDLGEAERMYRQVLDEDPSHHDARLGLAEVVNWSGRHRLARGMYRDVLRDTPDDTEAIKGLAYAQSWAGRPDLALTTLRRAEPKPDLLGVAREINNTGRLRGSNGFSYRDNTTDGDLRAVRSELTLSPTNLIDVGVAYTRAKLTQPASPDIDRDEFVAMLRQRFSEALEIHANPGVRLHRFDPVTPPGGQEIDEFDLFIWDAYVTITPMDWVRVDVGNSRESMDIPLPIFREIDVTTSSVGVDWRVHRRLLTVGQARYADYSDSNARLSFAQRIDWTAPFRLPSGQANRFVLSEGLEYSDFKKEADNGYFSPLSYAYFFGGLRFVTDLGKRVNLDLAGRLGAEKESGLDWTSVASFDGALTIHVGPEVYLRTGYSHSGSRLDSPDGFRSKRFVVSLDYAFSGRR